MDAVFARSSTREILQRQFKSSPSERPALLPNTIANEMDEQDAHIASDNSLICPGCGRSFMQLNAYSNHTGSCRSQKKRMASALDAARETYRKKKKPRLADAASSHSHLLPQLNQPEPEPQSAAVQVQVSAPKLFLCKSTLTVP